jgi:chromosome segregation ATPase
MGQVSLLEDIEKNRESLEALKGETLRPPTALSIAAQEKRLEKERQRLHELSVSLIAIAKSMQSKVDGPNFKDARALLEIQDVRKNIQQLQAEKTAMDKQNQTVRVLIKEKEAWLLERAVLISKLDILQKGYSFDGKSAEIRLQEIKRFIAVSALEISEQHPRIQILKKQLADAKKVTNEKNQPPKRTYWRSE